MLPPSASAGKRICCWSKVRELFEDESETRAMSAGFFCWSATKTDYDLHCNEEAFAVRSYLDVSCLNRPFDDQLQLRRRLESEAVITILGQIERGFWTQVSSRMAEQEIEAMPDENRRQQVALLLPE